MKTFENQGVHLIAKLQKTRRALAFSMIELLIAAGVLGLVLLPLLLTGTTMLAKGISASYTHAKANFQVLTALNSIAASLDEAKELHVPELTGWNPANYLEVEQYNPNTGLMETVGYSLQETGGNWHLIKMVNDATKAVSPYATLNSNEVILTLDSGVAPTFSYCRTASGTESCTSDASSLEEAAIRNIEYVRLNIDKFIVNAVGATAKEAVVKTGSRRFYIGGKYGLDADSSSDSSLAAFESAVSLSSLYGVSSASDIKALASGFTPGSGASLSLPTSATTVIPFFVESIYNGSDYAHRNFFDFIRGTSGYPDERSGEVRLFDYEFGEEDAGSDYADGEHSNLYGEQFPFVFDELTGRMFYTARYDNSHFSNPLSKTMVPTSSVAGTAIIGHDFSNASLDYFVVWSDGTDIHNRQVALVPDEHDGLLWALMKDNTGETKVLGIDTSDFSVEYEEDLSSLMPSATTFEYTGAWDQNSKNGDLFLAVNYDDNPAVVRFSAIRNGTSFIISSSTASTTGPAPHMMNYYADQLMWNEARDEVIMHAGTNFYRSDGDSTFTSIGTSTSPCYTGKVSPTEAYSVQPSQRKSWYHQNYMYGMLNDGTLIEQCDADESLWIDHPRGVAYYGGTDVQSVQRAGATTTPINITLNSGANTLNSIGVNRSIGVSDDGSVLVFGAEYGTGTGASFVQSTAMPYVTVFYDLDTDSVIHYFDHRNEIPIVAPIKNTTKIAATGYHSADKTYLVKVFDTATGWFTRTAGFDKDLDLRFHNENFRNDKFKREQFIAFDPVRQVAYARAGNRTGSSPHKRSKSNSYQDGAEPNMLNPTADFRTGTNTVSHYIRLIDLGFYFWEDALQIAEESSHAYMLLQGNTRDGMTKPDRLARFICHRSVQDSKYNNAAPCILQHELTLTGMPALPDYSTMTDDGLTLAINRMASNTKAFVLNNGVVYEIPNRLSLADSVSVSSLFSPGTNYTSMAVSSLTGNFYLLDASGLVTQNGTDGFMIHGFNASGARDTDLDIFLPIDAGTTGSGATALSGTDYSNLDEMRLHLDESLGHLHVVSAIPGKEYLYTYSKPSGHPL